MYFHRMCFYIFGNEVFLFVLDDTELFGGYYPLCPLYPVQDETLNDVCITSVVSYCIRVYAHTEIGLFVHIIFGVGVFEFRADVGKLECVCMSLGKCFDYFNFLQFSAYHDNCAIFQPPIKITLI